MSLVYAEPTGVQLPARQRCGSVSSCATVVCLPNYTSRLSLLALLFTRRFWQTLLKRSHLIANLNACAREQIDHLLCTQPSNWNRTSEMLWRTLYDAFPKV